MKPISVAPPLRGEWFAVTTPGDKIPSHGAHNWGMTYAYDFVRIKITNDGTSSWHKKSKKEYNLAQVKLTDTYGWGEPIYAPIGGVVRELENEVKERSRLHILSDFGFALLNSLFFSYKHGKVKTLGGNYLIIEGDNYSAFIAHAKTGSIIHKVGDTVNVGDKIAEVGHSGNSTAPHLHFQLMDRADIRNAKGIPCCFDSMDIFNNDTWNSVSDHIPSSKYIVRFIASE